MAGKQSDETAEFQRYFRPMALLNFSLMAFAEFQPAGIC
jgi:hypothetical protein